MRIYELSDNWQHEIIRDVLKRGKWVSTGRMQDRETTGDEQFDTKEIMNYSFALLNVGNYAKLCDSLGSFDKIWADHEFAERIADAHINPGIAWKIREKIWTEFLVRNKGKFTYTYNERIRTQLMNVCRELVKHKFTRQAVLSIFSSEKDNDKIGIDRIPCSMYYQFLYRNEQLHVIYNMRSCDVFTHYSNDIYLAIQLLYHIAELCEMPVGNFYMNIGSLHAYRKDIPTEDIY